ncbi:hypothetical protein D6C95_09088 [Aureobasidium pullulans]|nr:hypothetical protein D6C95_09088 [Aureobasidium pullulans]
MLSEHCNSRFYLLSVRESKNSSVGSLGLDLESIELKTLAAREQKVLDTVLQWGERYLDAALVLKYGLDKSRDAATQAARAGNHIEATSHVRAAAEHADKLLEVSIQLSRPGRQPQPMHTSIKTQLDVLQTVIQALGSRATSRVWAFVQIASRSNYEVHY